MISNKDPQSPKSQPPTIEAFREMIDGYESLHSEIEAIAPIQIFNSWFQVSDMIVSVLINLKFTFYKLIRWMCARFDNP